MFPVIALACPGAIGSGIGKVGTCGTIGNIREVFVSNARPLVFQDQICRLYRLHVFLIFGVKMIFPKFQCFW